MNFNNLSKRFRYVNDNGESIVFDWTGGFLINKPNGIDSVSISLLQSNGINQVGSLIQSKNVQPRAVNITGYVVGDNQSVKKDRLLSVIRPDIGGRLYADDYYLSVYPTATPNIEPKKINAMFQFSVLAAYPYWCKDNSATAVLSGIINQFKFPWNLSREYQFGSLMETQFMNVSNRGQVPIPFTAIFSASGTVVNPKITNANTLKFLLLNKTMVSGERIVIAISHERTTVTSSVDGDVRGALSLTSNMFRLDVGDNVLKPEATSGLSNLQVSIDYATEIVGISL